MSKLNINRNLFLEREELLRWQKFMLESPVNRTFLVNTLTWGIVDTGGGAASTDFLLAAGTSAGTVKMVKASVALTSTGNLIDKEAFDNLAVTADSNWYWIKIAHQYSNLEDGTIVINTEGELTGTGTKFTEVLRGQSTDVPVKIKLISNNNQSIYEVVDVIDDENAILMGDTFAAETGLKYYVVGSTPLGETITSEQEEGLYLYDDCLITFVQETVLDTAPAGLVANEEFWVARVKNTAGTVTVQDKRTQFWEYYIKGVSDKLSKDENLGDLDDAVVARDNLNVYSKEEVEALLNVDSTTWLTLSRGGAASATNYSIKLKRVGKLCICQGTFLATSGASVVGATVASIAESLVGGTISTPIYFSSLGYIAGDDNKGLKMSLRASGGTLSILIDDLSAPANTEYRFNFSFFIDV